jgi:hypothetical protein
MAAKCFGLPLHFGVSKIAADARRYYLLRVSRDLSAMSVIRFLFRLLATIAWALAVILAVLDATRTIAASRLVLTPLGDTIAKASPAAFAGLRTSAEHLAPFLWNPVMLWLLALPGFAVFLVLGLLFQAIGTRRTRFRGPYAVN